MSLYLDEVIFDIITPLGGSSAARVAGIIWRRLGAQRGL
jgi:hypothetical protein